MTEFPWRLVTFDIDGTLTTVHGWQYIADRLGHRPLYDATHRGFFARTIEEDEHLHDLLSLAENQPLELVEKILADTPRVAGIRETASALHSRGARLALLTHNPNYVCDWYRRSFGFDDYEGLDGQEVVRGVVQPPHDLHADKMRGMHRLCERLQVRPAATVHVGDGWADIPVFRSVGGGVALNSTLPEVDRAADRQIRTSDLRNLLPLLDGMRPRSPLTSAS